MPNVRFLLVCAVGAAYAWASGGDAVAQPNPYGAAAPAVQLPGAGLQAVGAPGMQPSHDPSKPGEPAKPGSVPGKPGESKPGKGKPEAKAEKVPPPVQRPTKPPKPPDPEELKVRPDAEGLVAFNFKNQPWEGVLNWLADISGMSLDWQELPGDYLNLSTPRKYKVEEVRDLINRHLLARGFTLLTQDNVLSLVSIKSLNPAMVPRIAPEDLARRSPHEYVRVCFPLDWMLAETLVEELKPMVSSNGKLTAMKGTNRLEAMDAVINLRYLQSVISEEQSPRGAKIWCRSFR